MSNVGEVSVDKLNCLTIGEVKNAEKGGKEVYLFKLLTLLVF